MLSLAKIYEIEKWKENNVFEPPQHVGQQTASSRWVITEKLNNGKKVIKAWLVARGFEEGSSNILKDSPTCAKEGMRLILTLLASNKWPCNAIDIKSALLQGKQFERPVFIILPL